MYTVSQWLWLRVQQIGYHCLKAPHKATIKVLAESVVLLRGLMGELGSKMTHMVVSRDQLFC